jgi:hypothetical protein
MRHNHCCWVIFILLLPMAIGGCAESRSSSKPLSTDNVRFMDMLTLYNHCTETDDREAMRVDAQVLSRAVDVLDSAADPRIGPDVRVSADPAAMAAACALRAGQVAQGEGDLSSAREMFQMIVIQFPQPRYAYYRNQARERLEQLNAPRSGLVPPSAGCLGGPRTMEALSPSSGNLTRLTNAM